MDKKIEHAFFVPTNKIELLKNTPKKYRIYYGNEFCEHLLPSVEQIRKVKTFAKENNHDFTLVLPWITDKYSSKIISLIEELEERDEVVCNDWGVIQTVIDLGLENKINIIIGRLLNTQKKDPRAYNGEHRTLQSPPFLNGEFGKFLDKYNIKRIETDDPRNIQNFSGTHFLGHIHTPFTYITTTRKCLLANSSSLKQKTLTIGSCKKECQDTAITMESIRMPQKIMLKGNSQFLDNSNIEIDETTLIQNGITRIIHHSILPM